MLSKVKRSVCYCTMDRTYYISSLQRCVQSTAVKITWNLWLASYLQRSLSSLKVHSTSTVKASFFFSFFLASSPGPAPTYIWGRGYFFFCFSYSSMYCLFFPFSLSLSSFRCDLSPPGSLPLAGGDGGEGGVCHHQGNNRCCKQSSHFDHMT